ncbi:LacI family transcriptional regulator [Arthrobacter sp. StoSoilB5]|nr:LacI family transcriptional regulator [Arthrobacter sp. StoSoilB5]
MPGRRKAPTILDIAAEAGVSKSAVSRALLGQGEVSDVTRERVEAAARRLGYVANAMAAGLRSRTRTLGVVLRDVNRPYYSRLFAALQEQAETRGYRLVAMTSAGELEVDDAIGAMKSLISLQVDGLILASAQLDSELVKPYIDRVPMVVAGRMELGTVSGVYGDEADGGRQLADYLLDAGHRRIAVGVVDQAYSRSQHLCTSAMVEQITKRGAAAVAIEVGSDWDLVANMDRIVEDTSLTALMCPTDAAMVDVLEVLRQRGLSCPDDLSVTGYGGIGALAQPFFGFTSFRQPVDHIGAQAVDLIIRAIDADGNLERTHIAIGGSLIPGRTVRPVTVGASR